MIDKGLWLLPYDQQVFSVRNRTLFLRQWRLDYRSLLFLALLASSKNRVQFMNYKSQRNMNSRWFFFFFQKSSDTFCLKFWRFFNPFFTIASAGYPKSRLFKLCLETGFHFKYFLNRDSQYFSFKIKWK